jgi:hypothetical protein
MSDRVAAQYEYFLLRLRGGCVSTAPFRVLADATDWIQLQHLCLSLCCYSSFLFAVRYATTDAPYCGVAVMLIPLLIPLASDV